VENIGVELSSMLVRW